MVVSLIGLFGGFFYFINGLEDHEIDSVPHAEGIVALTGGAERISDALDLIATGHAARLLISGVNQSTSGEEITRHTPGLRNWIHCCVDLGYDAQNTIGNAEETRRWAMRRGFSHRLIVVTSNYHMPRALLEISRALPGVELVPYPVVSEKARSGIWADPQMARTVALEYLKYVVALARTSFSPAPVPSMDPVAATWLRHANSGR